MQESLVGDSDAEAPFALDNALNSAGQLAVLGQTLGQKVLHTFDAASKFVDISGTGTPLILADDGEATITTTVGNSLFPAGPVTIGNNGGIIAGAGEQLSFLPESLPTGDFTTGILPWWTDLFTGGAIYWQETTIEGKDALVVQWDQKNHYWVENGFVTFQLQLFADEAMPLRFAYTDAVFGDVLDDYGASGVIGYQVSSTEFAQFSAFGASLQDNSVISFVTTDDDHFTVDLSDHVGQEVDLLFSGLNGASFEGAVLELLDPNGNVVATGSPDPTGFDANNFELGITDFSVSTAGVYGIRLANMIGAGEYVLIIDTEAKLETESNNLPTDTLRQLIVGQKSSGWLKATAPADSIDMLEISLQEGQRILLTTTTPMGQQQGMTTNTLDPSVSILDTSNNLLASDSNSGSDGVNARLIFTAPATGTYRLAINSEAGEGAYQFSVTDLPEVIHGVGSVVIADGTAQRSRVDQLTVTFDEEVTIEEGAFELTKRGTQGGPVEISVDSTVNGNGQTVAVISFLGDFTSDGRLLNGNYDLRIVANKVYDASESLLDGDGDGVAGGDLIFGAEEADQFYSLFGDADGSRTVNMTDFGVFRNAFGKQSGDEGYNPIMNSNGDDAINLVDFGVFRNNFGSTLNFE